MATCVESSGPIRKLGLQPRSESWPSGYGLPHRYTCPFSVSLALWDCRKVWFVEERLAKCMPTNFALNCPSIPQADSLRLVVPRVPPTIFLCLAGSVLCGESLVQLSGPPQGEPARSPPPCGPAEEGRTPGEIPRLRVSQGPPVVSRHSPGLAPQPDSSLRTGQRSLQVPAAPSSQLSSSSSGSSSTCAVPTANVLVLQASQCSMAKACRQPPIVFLPKLVYDMFVSTDSSGLPKSASLLPSPSVMWTSSFRPLLSKTMTSTEQSLYYRQWTVPRPSHMDYGNRAEGRADSFHPRRLLLSGPPQVSAVPAAPAQARLPESPLVPGCLLVHFVLLLWMA